jgi:UDP-N-acetylmuramate dehydrogenase
MKRASGALLAPLTTLGIGGAARSLVSIESEADLSVAVRDAGTEGAPLLVLGGGSNVVLGDQGFDGVVLHLCNRGVVVHPEADAVVLDVAAGEPWDGFVERCVAEGLSGVECLSGIPGLVGATPIQNVGAYGQDVSETIVSVRLFDRTTAEFSEVSAAQCGFAYRTSVFKGGERFIVTSVRFRLTRSSLSQPLRYAELTKALGLRDGARAPSSAVRATVIALRRRKGMVLDPSDGDSVSVGSFFVNPIVPVAQADRVRALTNDATMPCFAQRDGAAKLSAGWLIERAGFEKGYARGRAAISSKHALALVNRGGATSAEVLDLAREIRDGVRGRFGVELTPEPVIVGARGVVRAL